MGRPHHKAYKDTNATRMDNTTKETKTIRVSIDTLDKLKRYGVFGDNWNNCIQRLISKRQSLQKQLQQMKQKTQKKQKKQK